MSITGPTGVVITGIVHHQERVSIKIRVHHQEMASIIGIDQRPEKVDTSIMKDTDHTLEMIGTVIELVSHTKDHRLVHHKGIVTDPVVERQGVDLQGMGRKKKHQHIRCPPREGADQSQGHPKR